MSGERGGHGVGPSIPLRRFGNIASKNWRASNPSVAVHHPVGELPMAETLLTEVQNKAASCPGKRLLKWCTQEKKEWPNNLVD
jgi:hypothetical protein